MRFLVSTIHFPGRNLAKTVLCLVLTLQFSFVCHPFPPTCAATPLAAVTPDELLLAVSDPSLQYVANLM